MSKIKSIHFKKCVISIFKYNNIKDFRMVVMYNGDLVYDVGTNYSPITQYSCLLSKASGLIRYLRKNRASKKAITEICNNF